MILYRVQFWQKPKLPNPQHSIYPILQETKEIKIDKAWGCGHCKKK